MYPVSEAFHQAVKDGNHQIAMMIFDDAVFTNADINVDVGIEFHDYFNLEENLSIGQTPSNEISFSLFNDDRSLNSYEFGDFLATIGVLLDTTEYDKAGNVFVQTTFARYVGMTESPYLTRNGIGLNTGFPVVSILSYDGKVWAFSADGDCACYNDQTGARVAWTLNTFMRAKVKKWNGIGLKYSKDARILVIYDDGTQYRYEFCPLGWFIAERPNAPDKIEINFTCYDLMQRFDEDMPGASELGISYPTTVKNLFKKLCDYVGLPYRTLKFINADVTIDAEPDEFSNSTMRTVMGWIAEAAGSNVRVDRDGYVIMDWVRNTTQRYDEHDYSDFERYWYRTKKVTKLYNRSVSDASERTVGSGKEGYLIQDNPLLKGVT